MESRHFQTKNRWQWTTESNFITDWNNKAEECLSLPLFLSLREVIEFLNRKSLNFVFSGIGQFLLTAYKIGIIGIVNCIDVLYYELY